MHLLAETGLRSGQNLHFHRSHKRGVAVDIHLPVRFMGEPSSLPSSVFTLWGYLWRFNDEAQSSALAWDMPKNCEQKAKLGLKLPMPSLYQIDFDELARLLAAVVDEDRATRSTKLRYVILWRPYVEQLKRNPTYKELFGKKSKRRIKFELMCATPIHDEHIHLHFRG